MRRKLTSSQLKRALANATKKQLYEDAISSRNQAAIMEDLIAVQRRQIAMLGNQVACLEKAVELQDSQLAIYERIQPSITAMLSECDDDSSFPAVSLH